MILADTCIWIDFFRNRNEPFAQLLNKSKINSHWIVIGELASGNLPARQQTLADLRNLPRVQPASSRESLALIENHALYGHGLSWNDLQLLASSLIYHIPIWTHDKRLKSVAMELNACYLP